MSFEGNGTMYRKEGSRGERKSPAKKTGQTKFPTIRGMRKRARAWVKGKEREGSRGKKRKKKST